jgi:hypothetical protein
VYLNDTERMLLVSCMDVDPYAPSQILSPAALPPWLQQQHLRSGGSVDGSGTTSSGAGSGRSVATEGGGSGSLSNPTTTAPSNALGRVVSMGRLTSSKSAVFVSLMGIHMLVGHWIPRVWPGQTMSDSWRVPPCTVVTPPPTFCCNRFCHSLPFLALQAMGVVLLVGAVIVVLYRLVHTGVLSEWRGPVVAAGTGTGIVLFATLGLRSANSFHLQSVSRSTESSGPLL